MWRERAVQVRRRYSQELQSQWDIRIATEVADDGGDVASS